LNALAVQFDGDKNGSPSPDEQKPLLRFVEERHGQKWADRVTWFLKRAGANGNGAIDRGLWTGFGWRGTAPR
jgi:hypothetical protein